MQSTAYHHINGGTAVFGGGLATLSTKESAAAQAYRIYLT
jgi:hypothetical protein